MAKQQKRLTRRDKINAGRQSSQDEKAMLRNAVAALGDRMAVVEAVSGIKREEVIEGPKPRPGRDFIGKKEAQ